VIKVPAATIFSRRMVKMRIFNSALRRLPADIRLSRRGMFGIVAFSALFLAACSAGVQTTKVGDFDVAPDFELSVFHNANHQQGDQVSLSGLEGKPVVVNFWYPSCPPCRLEMPDLQATFEKHKDDGLEFVGVQSLILDTVEEGQEFIDEFEITYAVGPDEDGSILIDYGAVNFPTTVFLDKNHEIVKVWAGLLTAEKLEEIIAPLIQ
jgi:peroxiredoxin